MYPRYETAIDAIDLLQLQYPGRCIDLLKISIRNAGEDVQTALPLTLENAIAEGLQARAGDGALVTFADTNLIIVATPHQTTDALDWARHLLGLFDHAIQVHRQSHLLRVTASLVSTSGKKQPAAWLLNQAANEQIFSTAMLET